GNLANAVAAGAAASGLRAVILVPEDLEAAKLVGSAVYGATLVGVRGNYDRVNRLCAEICDRHGWGIVNGNRRAYYAEGSQTEGLFAETKGGTVVAAARRLAQAGAFADGEPVVLQISGQGMKTVEALQGRPPFAAVIDGRLADFEAFWNQHGSAA